MEKQTIEEMIYRTEKPKHKTKVDPKDTPYTEELWKGVKIVYKCSTCGTFRDDIDSIILHVITHAPKDKQDELLAKLLKEK